MQEKIHNIIESNISKNKKIKQLKDLFIQEKISYFSDFDDTLSQNNCVFYTKVKLLKKFHKFDKKYQHKLLSSFKVNPKFPNLSEKIVIISRNNFSFLEEFLKKYQKVLQKQGINIVGVIGQNNFFGYSSREKLDFLPPNSYFIGDVFEDISLQNYNSFILVKRFNIFQKCFINFKKIFILVIFIIKGC